MSAAIVTNKKESDKFGNSPIVFGKTQHAGFIAMGGLGLTLLVFIQFTSIFGALLCLMITANDWVWAMKKERAGGSDEAGDDDEWLPVDESQVPDEFKTQQPSINVAHQAVEQVSQVDAATLAQRLLAQRDKRDTPAASPVPAPAPAHAERAFVLPECKGSSVLNSGLNSEEGFCIQPECKGSSVLNSELNSESKAEFRTLGFQFPKEAITNPETQRMQGLQPAEKLNSILNSKSDLNSESKALTLTVAFDPTKPEQPGEYEQFRRAMALFEAENTDFDSKGFARMVVWGCGPGGSKRATAAVARENKFLARLDKEKEAVAA